jgi:uncharacterized membrane protein YgdD (TMEM256/DUF423 family)
MNHARTLQAAGLLGALGVGLGAFGAHWLRDFLVERGAANAWETAVRYHLLHSVALLGLAAWAAQPASAKPATLRWIGRLWVAGILLFCGSLYGLALGGPRWLGPVTPLGGLGFVVGWILVFVAARSAKKNAD